MPTAADGALVRASGAVSPLLRTETPVLASSPIGANSPANDLAGRWRTSRFHVQIVCIQQNSNLLTRLPRPITQQFIRRVTCADAGLRGVIGAAVRGFGICP
jgi:hypothetical protein